MKFTYSVNETMNDPADRLEYEDSWAYNENELWMVMNEIADDYWSNHDGWELQSWPNKFYLYSENNQYLGVFSVDMEQEPRFYATRIEDDAEVAR